MSKQITKLKKELRKELDSITKLLNYEDPPIEYKDKVDDFKSLCDYPLTGNWIYCDGIDPELPEDTVVILRLRGGRETNLYNAGDWNWGTTGEYDDIIAYREPYI